MSLLRWVGCSALAIALAGTVGACHGSDASSPSAPSSALDPQLTPRTFKVATWNIRSGKGIRGFTTTSWSSDTANCTDHSQPLNAWGIGLTQAALGKVRDDQSVVAMALQEAWFCGSPQNVQAVVGFKTASTDRNGTGFLARYGLSGAMKYLDIGGAQTLIGGDVCLDPACTATIPMYSVHFDGSAEEGIPNQAQKVIDILGAQSGPRLFMGDLNIYKVDTWNPSVPCTGGDNAGRVRTMGMIESAGYTDAWKATQNSEGWTGMQTRAGCGIPSGNLFKRIDYVHSSGMRTLSTDRFGRAEPGGDAASDHVGLIAELSATPVRAASQAPAKAK
jgi:hypothetical protein